MKSNRYKTSHLPEDQYEPGSRGRVLKNQLSIQSRRKMDAIEGQEYVRAYSKAVKVYGQSHRFTAEDICRIHKIWMGPIYPWAGRYRQVNLTKDNFPFAPAGEIPRLMKEFEEGPLRKFTPCKFPLQEKIIEALAIVHVELVLIHPFREGNGRLSRLLAGLMALQAGLPTLDFSPMASGKRRKEYFVAIQAGLGRDYQPMEKVFNAVVEKTLRMKAAK